MIAFVDSSVWIDLFADRQTIETLALTDITQKGGRLLVGDLVLVEVPHGTRTERDFARTLARMTMFDRVAIASPALAVEAARNYRRLRDLGITVRKTIDTLIATRCILDDLPLSYRDRDFHPVVQHLGLRSAIDAPTGVN